MDTSSLPPYKVLQHFIESGKEITVENNKIKCDGQELDENEDSKFPDLRKQYNIGPIYYLYSLKMKTTGDFYYGTYKQSAQDAGYEALIYSDQKKVLAYYTSQNTEAAAADTTDQTTAESGKVEKEDQAGVNADDKSGVASRAKPATDAKEKEDISGRTPKDREFHSLKTKLDEALKEGRPMIEFEYVRTIDAALEGRTDYKSLVDKAAEFDKKNQRTSTEIAEQRRFKRHIILVHRSVEQVLNNSNLANFLEYSRYTDPTENPDIKTTIKHYHSSSGKEMEFDIISDIHQLDTDDWKYVVAIFLIGKKWQLKDFVLRDGKKSNDPSRIFNDYLGVFVHFEPSNKKFDADNWNVKRFGLDKSKDYKIDNIVSSIWEEIEKKCANVKRNR